MAVQAVAEKTVRTAEYFEILDEDVRCAVPTAADDVRAKSVN